MNITFHKSTGIFHLYNNDISYLMMILPNGQIGQLYFGAAIRDREDFSHLLETCYRTNSAYYSEELNTMCLEPVSYTHLNQKYILVTGASRGIGRSIALKFAREGYHVFLNCRTSLNELEEVQNKILSMPGGSCTITTGDVGDPDQVRRMFQEIHKICPGLDVLVNNAGISHIGLLIDMTDNEWDRLLASNLSSAFYCSREALKDMVSAKSGRILNISSMWGTVGASCEAAYSAVKSGMNGLTKALAKEYAPSHIAVNALACGVIDTEMNHQLSSEERAALAEDIPAGRFADPDEVADLAWQIINSPEYMTGQVIGIDGGYI